jgi:hypothetical protein
MKCGPDLFRHPTVLGLVPAAKAHIGERGMEAIADDAAVSQPDSFALRPVSPAHGPETVDDALVRRNSAAILCSFSIS